MIACQCQTVPGVTEHHKIILLRYALSALRASVGGGQKKAHASAAGRAVTRAPTNEIIAEYVGLDVGEYVGLEDRVHWRRHDGLGFDRWLSQIRSGQVCL